MDWYGILCICQYLTNFPFIISVFLKICEGGYNFRIHFIKLKWWKFSQLPKASVFLWKNKISTWPPASGLRYGGCSTNFMKSLAVSNIYRSNNGFSQWCDSHTFTNPILPFYQNSIIQIASHDKIQTFFIWFKEIYFMENVIYVCFLCFQMIIKYRYVLSSFFF